MRTLLLLSAGRRFLPNANRGPLARLGLTILAVFSTVVAIFLGTLVFLAVLGIAAVGSIILMARVWRLRRAMRRAQAPPRAGGDASVGGGRVIDGEYTVLRPDR